MPSTGRGETDPEEEPAWLGPLEFDEVDLHYDLRHPLVSRFRVGLADSDTDCRHYDGSVFAARLKKLEPRTLRVVRPCPLYQTVLAIRELVHPNASRQFCSLF